MDRRCSTSAGGSWAIVMTPKTRLRLSSSCSPARPARSGRRIPWRAGFTASPREWRRGQGSTRRAGGCASAGARRALAIQKLDYSARDHAEASTELYHELGRLPDRYRRPILLGHLEGLTYQWPRKKLGCPVRTVQSRLARGRERLRDRLTRAGVAPAPVAVIAGLTPDPASAAVSESWKHATTTAAVRFAAGGHLASFIPPTVAGMAKGAFER